MKEITLYPFGTLKKKERVYVKHGSNFSRVH